MDESSESKNWEYFKKEYANYFLQYRIDENDPLDEIASDINDYHLGTINNDHIGREIHIFLGKLLLEQDVATKEEMNNGSRLFWAIYYNRNIEFIKSIVDMGVYVDKKTHDPDSDEDVMITPFFLAVRKRNIEVVKLLLDEDIEVNFKKKNNITPLLCAFERLYYEHDYGIFEVKKEWECIILLLLKHPDINIKESFETQWAGPNYDEIVGKTPLYLAIECDSFTIFDLLIKDPKTTIDLDSEFLPLKKIIKLYGKDMRYLKLFIQYYAEKIERAKFDAGIKTIPNPIPNPNPTPKELEFLVYLQGHVDKIYEDAMIDAVWYDNTEALKLLLENGNLTLPNTHTQLMARTAMLCNDGTAGPMVPVEMMDTIFSFFPPCESETYTFVFNSRFFLKFSENLFTNILSIAAAQCKKDMVEVILEHLETNIPKYKLQLLYISHKLKDMKAFQDKEIRDSDDHLLKTREHGYVHTPESSEKAHKAIMFLTKLNIRTEENRKSYKDREEIFNAIMKKIEEVEFTIWTRNRY